MEHIVVTKIIFLKLKEFKKIYQKNIIKSMEKEKEFNLVKSVYQTNFDTISNIMDLYKIDRFDLDCTYSKGSFWKDLKGPKIKTDLEPKHESIIHIAENDHHDVEIYFIFSLLMT